MLGAQSVCSEYLLVGHMSEWMEELIDAHVGRTDLGQPLLHFKRGNQGLKRGEVCPGSHTGGSGEVE